MPEHSARQRLDDIDYEGMILGAAARFDRRARLVIRPDLSVLWHSENAPELLRDPSPVVMAGGRLRFPATNRINEATAFLEKADESISRHLLRAAAKGHWALLEAWQLPLRHRAIGLVCTLSTPVRGVAESGLAEDLNLTRTETNVLDLFAKLRTPSQISETLGVSVATVRSHLKQIYSKAEVESAVQLLRLTGGYCGH